MRIVSKVVAAALLSALPVAAYAADMATKAAPVAYIPTTTDPFSGFYIGGAIGYGWDRGAGNGSATAGGVTGESSFATSPQGAVGGLHLGVGTRFGGSWYAGVEAAGGIGTLDGTPQSPGLAFDVNSKNHWLMSFSGRLGYILTPNLMVYGRGGWSWAGAEFTATDFKDNTFSTKPVLDGPMLGAGIEAALTANWIVGVEYQHYFLGDISASTSGFVVNSAGLTVPAVFSARVSNNIDTVLGRLSYKF